MKVLVTGASGYLGQHVVRALAGANREVVALTRRPEVLARLPVKVEGRGFSSDVPGDLLEAGMSVIHLAAVRNRPGHSARDLEQINHLATARFGAACRDAGVGRFVHLGTAAMAFTADGSDPYALSKLRGLEALEGIEGLPLVSLLPTIIFGPPVDGARNRIADHIRLVLRSPLLATIGPGGAERNLVYVDDVVRAILNAERSAVTGRHVIAGENVSLSELDNRIARICSLRRRVMRIPAGPAFLAARFADILRRFERQCGYRHRLETLVRAWPVDARNRSELQTNVTSLDEGLRRTIASLQKQK